MKDNVDNWTKLAWATLESIPAASEAMAHHRSRWEDFRTLEALEVNIFGAYDAGKSSLLKRLLAELKAPTPSWLTVSARRETFESNRVEAAGFGFTDTPGLSSGNSEHDALTLNAMKLADAYLWLLPPQLVTSGRERFTDILFGDAGIAGVTIAVVARMDEAGVDPSDNETDYRDLCRRKQEELITLVAANCSTKKLQSIHCVVADPYQLVNNLPNPGPENYDIGRSWDGIKCLIREIFALQERRHELRSLAGARYVRMLLKEVSDHLAHCKKELALVKEGLNNEVERFRICEHRLDILHGQAKAKLRCCVEDTLLSMSRSGNVGVDSIRNLEEALAKELNQWIEASFEDYRKLVNDLKLEVRERMAGPSMDGFRRLAEEAEDSSAKELRPKLDPIKTGRKILALGPDLQAAFKNYASTELRMPLHVAAEHLLKLESSGETVKNFIEAQGRSGSFINPAHANKASEFVKWGNMLDIAGPLIVELSGLLLDVVGEAMTAKQAEERERRRRELREKIQTETAKLEKVAAANFDTICDGGRRWISELLTTINSERDCLSKKMEELEEATVSIHRMFATFPKEESSHAGV